MESITADHERERSLRDLYYVLFRHKWKSLLFFVVVVTVVTVGTLLSPNIYRSEAKLLVKPGRESVAVDPTVPEGRIISISRQMEEQLNSELEILKSRDLVERVVDAVGPERFLKKPGAESVLPVTSAKSSAVQDAFKKMGIVLGCLRNLPSRALVSLGIRDELTPREKAIEKLSKKLDVEVLRKSNVIRLAFESRSPQLSEEALDKLIDFYLEQHVQVYQTGGSYNFFKQQTAVLRSQLEAAEESLRTFKNTANIAALSEQRTAAIQRLEDKKSRIRDVDVELAASNATVTSLQRILDKMSQTVALEQVTGRPNYFMDDARVRLLDLRLQEKDLLAKYSEDSRSVQNIREQIKQAEAALAGEQETRTEQKTGINSSYQQLEMALLRERGKLNALTEQKEVLAEQVVTAEEELRVLNDNEARLAQLERERAIAEQNYRTYVDKLEETRISQALEQEKISNIATIQPATAPISAVKPRRKLNLALGLLLGLFGALGLSFASEYMDHSIRTPEDVEEKLHLTTLASIPRVKHSVVRPVLEFEGRSKLVARVIRAGSANWDLPKGLRDHYDTFLERLLIGSNGSPQGGYAIGVMSCYRGEGVSIVAANLATALAQHDDGRVLLMDTNAAHPSVHQIFGARLAPGLTEALAAGLKSDKGDGPIFHRAENLDLLTAGSSNGTSRRLLKPEAFSQFLTSAKQDYRFIVVDVPALSTDSSALRLAGTCDAAVMVVEAERLRWEVVRRKKEQLQQADVNIVGTVLNKRRFPIPNWIYASM